MYMSVGVMKDYKLKLRKLRDLHTGITSVMSLSHNLECVCLFVSE
jgi:hypothetical protein